MFSGSAILERLLLLLMDCKIWYHGDMNGAWEGLVGWSKELCGLKMDLMHTYCSIDFEMP